MRKLVIAIALLGCRATQHVDLSLGPRVAPPDIGVALGMSVNEARKANPKLEIEDVTGGLVLHGEGMRSIGIDFDFDGHVNGFVLNLPSSLTCIDEPKRAWGAPTGEHRDFASSKPRPMWRGPSWEAWLELDSQMCMVFFRPKGTEEKMQRIDKELTKAKYD